MELNKIMGVSGIDSVSYQNLQISCFILLSNKGKID